MPLSEFEIIRKVFQRPAKKPEVTCSIGDDCAVIQPLSGKDLVMSLDTLVKDVHFPSRAPAEWIGYRALAVCVSDLAAMGAEPSHFTLGLTLPNSDEQWLSDFAKGLFEAADAYKMDLIGGDTTKGPLTISIQVHGWVPTGKALLRSGAKEGDLIYVSHYIGDSAAELSEVLNNPKTAKPQAYYRPKPRIELGKALIDIATSALDLSDGLLGDLSHTCELSQCGADIFINRLPINPQTIQSVGPDQATVLALTGGDDYELCFTVPADQKPMVDELLEKYNLAGQCIGQIVSGDRVNVLDEQNNPVSISQQSYQHFEK